MIDRGLGAFLNKRVLLLQGPVGPFFARFARDLRWAGATVFKVNFNGGDWFFYQDNAIAFRGTAEEWPAFFESLLNRLNVDVLMLFGDCRRYHKAAHDIAERRGLEVGVFEEGYLRPNHITLERHGVNGNSKLPTSPIFYLNNTVAPEPSTKAVGNTFYHAAWWACVYTLMASLLKFYFPRYQHHRRLSIAEAYPWYKALLRKAKYALRERGAHAKLTTQLSKKYFLVPLQVHDDSQIQVHSTFNSVDQFIVETVNSFYLSAPADAVLVIKHHPLDRGHRDYTRLIAQLKTQFGLGQRLMYVHDLNLPSLLDHARGVIVINSTVGLSALIHKAPLKVCGEAVYNINGLVYQGDLDSFWSNASKQPFNTELLRRFRNYIINHSQINGSFYKRLSIPASFSGMCWANHDKFDVTPSLARNSKLKESPNVARKKKNA